MKCIIFFIYQLSLSSWVSLKMKWQRQWQWQFLCCNFHSLFLSIVSRELLKTQLCALSTSQPASVHLTGRAGGSEALPRNESSRAGSQTPSSSLNLLFFLREAEGAQIKTKQLDCRKCSIDCLGLTWGWEINNKEAIFCGLKMWAFFYLYKSFVVLKGPFFSFKMGKYLLRVKQLAEPPVLISSVPWHCLCSQGSWEKGSYSL